MISLNQDECESPVIPKVEGSPIRKGLEANIVHRSNAKLNAMLPRLYPGTTGHRCCWNDGGWLEQTSK